MNKNKRELQCVARDAKFEEIDAASLEGFVTSN